MLEVLLFLCIPMSTIYAQDTLTKSRNGFRDGDRIELQSLSGVSISEAEEGFTIDLSESELVGESVYRQFLQDSLQSFRVTGRGTERYLQDGNTLYYVGFENKDVCLQYIGREKCLTFPFGKGSTLAGELAASGKYGGRLSFSIDGTYRTMMDKTGRLILPNGRRLSQVLCLHTERAMTVADSLCLKEVQSCYYVPGYRYPVVENRTVSEARNGDVLLCQTLYSPVESQELLPLDDENIKIRRQVEEAMDKEDIPSSPKPRNISYTIHQNTSDRSVTIDYDLMVNGKGQFILANAKGMTFRTRTFDQEMGKGYSMTISYAGLPSDVYLLYISVNDEINIEKLNLK